MAYIQQENWFLTIFSEENLNKNYYFFYLLSVQEYLLL